MSATIGTAPITANDAFVVQGLFVQKGSQAPKFNPYAALSLFSPEQAAKLPHDNNRAAVLIPASISIVLIIFITGFRLFSRWWNRTSNLGWDDFFIVLAAAAGVASLSVQIGMVTHGSLGLHSYDQTYMQLYWFQRLGHINNLMFILYSGFSKLSIAFFNKRLTGRFSRHWIWIHRILFVFITSYIVIGFCFFLFTCRPIDKAFSLIITGQRLTDPYKCHLSNGRWGTSINALHIALDWLLLSIPIWVVSRLQLPATRKLLCVVPLAFGVIAGIASIMRYYYNLHPSKDATYNVRQLAAWSDIDIVVTICVTSLPAIAVLFARHLPPTLRKYFSSIHSSSPKTSRRPHVSGEHTMLPDNVLRAPSQVHLHNGIGKTDRESDSDLALESLPTTQEEKELSRQLPLFTDAKPSLRNQHEIGGKV